MSSVVIRNLPEETHRALKARAARHGRSTEAEMRDILTAAVHPPQRLRLGEALASLGRRVGLSDEEARQIEAVRDRTPAEPLRFE